MSTPVEKFRTTPILKEEMEFKSVPPDEMRRMVTRAAVGPHMAAVRVMLAAEGKKDVGREIDLEELTHCMLEQAQAINNGDMAQVEVMLMSQATSLQTLYARLIEKGMTQEFLPQFEAHMKLALRAQNQCRTTLQTLADIKNPPVLYAKQANIANGPQQVNNGNAVPSRGREIPNVKTQLLSEDQYGKGMDSGATCTSGRTHQAVAPLGTIDRP